MDDKHRIVIPARPRKKFMDLCEGEVVLTARTRDHVLLYALPEFESLMARLEALPDLDQTANDFKLGFTAHARDETIDRAGRLLLGAELRERAGLHKSVILVGRGNRFEIWDEARWNAESVARDARSEVMPLPSEAIREFRF